MPNYIDRDVAIEMITNDALDLVYYNKEEAIDCLKCVPIADVEEVRHAKWVHYGEDIQCSNCGHVSDDVCYEGDANSGYYTVLPYYCSKCGARMDLEDENNEQN